LLCIDFLAEVFLVEAFLGIDFLELFLAIVRSPALSEVAQE